MNIIRKQSAEALTIKKGDYLKVIDVKGKQVSELVFFSEADIREHASSNKTIEMEESLLFTKGNYLWSNRGRKLLKIISDSNGRNDFLIATCDNKEFSEDGLQVAASCKRNLASSLENFGIEPDCIPTSFKLFCNVIFDASGKLFREKPSSNAGDAVTFKALEDLIVGITACGSELNIQTEFREVGYIVAELREL